MTKNEKITFAINNLQVKIQALNTCLEELKKQRKEEEARCKHLAIAEALAQSPDPLAKEHPMFESYTKKQRADALAEVTQDAYSFGFYSVRGWRTAIYVLVERGFSNQQIAQLMRSKHTRWAGDNADRHDRKYTSTDLVKRYLDVGGIFLPSDYYKLGFTNDGCVCL